MSVSCGGALAARSYGTGGLVLTFVLSRFGETALHFAVRGGHAESINILLNFGADPFISGKEAGTIFKVAKKFRTPSIRNILREYVSSRGLDLPQELADTAEDDKQAASKKAKAKESSTGEVKRQESGAKEEKETTVTGPVSDSDDDKKRKKKAPSKKGTQSLVWRLPVLSISLPFTISHTDTHTPVSVIYCPRCCPVFRAFSHGYLPGFSFRLTALIAATRVLSVVALLGLPSFGLLLMNLSAYRENRYRTAIVITKAF